MRPAPSFENALPVILAEGQGCKCPHNELCGQTPLAWCRYLTRTHGGPAIVGYQDLMVAKCIYRDRPGCCWVLAAVETAATSHLQKLNIEAPPVPADIIGSFDSQRRIEVRSLPLKGYHGSAWLLGDEWVVYLNSEDALQVRRHTLFHEAFHILCRNADPAFRRVDMEPKPFRDVLADHFATSVLMPRHWVENQLETTTNLEALARAFDVTVPAIEYRIRQLGFSETHELLDKLMPPKLCQN